MAVFSNIFSDICNNGTKARTIGNAENSASVVEVILELVVEESEKSDQEMKEDEHRKE